MRFEKPLTIVISSLLKPGKHHVTQENGATTRKHETLLKPLDLLKQTIIGKTNLLPAGTFPSDWKRSKVTAIYKKSVCSKYRPINNPPVKLLNI